MAASRNQSEAAYELIKESVVTGHFVPAEALSETQLAEYCNVSRTPVREALQRLENDGLLVNDGRSWRVSSPKPDEIYEMYETKAILETAAVSLAAERRTDLDLAHLRRVAQAAGELTLDTPLPERIAVNHEFHAALWRACHNKSLTAFLERIGTPHVRFGGLSTLSQPGQWEKAVQYNDRIIEALAVRDAATAVELVRQQVEDVRDVRIRMWQERQASLASA